MEKKYIEATAALVMGKVKMIFDDVKNYTDAKDEDGKITHFEFDDKDGHYSYNLNGRLYEEENDKAPDIVQFRVIGRRTAVRHELVNNRYRDEVTPDEWQDEKERYE